MSGVAVNGLVIQGVPLTVNGGTLTQFDNVSFAGLAPEAIQLTINHPGLPASFAILGISFSTNPTTGRLILANDTQADANTLVLDLFGAVPADGSADTQTVGGAIVNWLFNPGEANLVSRAKRGADSGGGGNPADVHDQGQKWRPGGGNRRDVEPGRSGWSDGCRRDRDARHVRRGRRVVRPRYDPGRSRSRRDRELRPCRYWTLVTTATVTATQADSVARQQFHVVAATIVPAGAGVNLSIAKTDSADPVIRARRSIT